MRALLRSYREAGGTQPVVLLHDGEHGEPMIDALARFGTGTTGSRMASGSFGSHLALERDLAEFYGQQHGMVFTTGYAANLGMLPLTLNTGSASTTLNVSAIDVSLRLDTSLLKINNVLKGAALPADAELGWSVSAAT